MKVKILGCSGGIGGKENLTTSLMVDEDILIDAGTGVGSLNPQALARIDHVFLTHSHLDHIACLPFIPDTVGELRSKPLTVYATRETIEALTAHIFNWTIWPDFTEIPTKAEPFMRFQEISVGQPVSLGKRAITALPASHTVPAVGYCIDSGKACLVFSGDTTSSDDLWAAVNKLENLRYLIIEAAFSDKDKKLAMLSKHLCPSLLAEELQKLNSRPQIFLTHLKPAQADLIMGEAAELLRKYQPRLLENGHILEL